MTLIVVLFRRRLVNKPHVYRVIYRISEKQKRAETLHLRPGARRNFKVSALCEPLARLEALPR
jgi:hypothetical protein